MAFRILLITTGGTIAQTHDEDGRTIQGDSSDPFQECVNGIVEKLNEKSFESGTYNIEGVDIVDLLNKDSSNIIPEDWVKLIDQIVDNYKKYSAFVITHGTNTLGYTSAALSFALGRFGKPVVLTGSQVSFGFPGSDAQMNLENAIRIAAYSEKKIAGVMVVFGSMIISGTRVKKTTEFDYDAFKSFNSGTLGRIGNSVRFEEKPLADHMEFLGNIARTKEELDVNKVFETRIASLTEYPGMRSAIFKALVESRESEVRGFIFRATGAGDPNVADSDAPFENLREGFEYLLKKEIPIVVTTQAPDGIASMDINTPGILAYKLGAIPARDMSMESMTVKLAWLLGKGTPYSAMREQMTMPYRGEIRRK
jgi:L-asparaginase